jgi:hypothetical protein
MTLYLDKTVTWGGEQIGGIRLSHLSHIGDEPLKMKLTSTRGKKATHIFEPLTEKKPQRSLEELVGGYISKLGEIETLEALQLFQSSEQITKFRDRVRDANEPDLEDKIIAANTARAAALQVDDKTEESAEPSPSEEKTEDNRAEQVDENQQNQSDSTTDDGFPNMEGS